eukprot:scaffold3932_cov87-Cyclotella_meneghiniana.AAC.25
MVDDMGFDEGDWEEPEELDWKWIDIDFLDDCNTNAGATTPAVNVQSSPMGETEHTGSRCKGLTK